MVILLSWLSYFLFFIFLFLIFILKFHFGSQTRGFGQTLNIQSLHCHVGGICNDHAKMIWWSNSVSEFSGFFFFGAFFLSVTTQFPQLMVFHIRYNFAVYILSDYTPFSIPFYPEKNCVVHHTQFWLYFITFPSRIPEASRASKLIRFSIKAFVGIFLAWGFYKLGKYTRIASYIPYLH